MVPFSNPIQLFYEEKEFVLQVILFLLEVIVAPNSNTRPLQFLNHGNPSPVESSLPMPSLSTPATASKNIPVTETKTTPRKSPIPKSSRGTTSRSIDEASPPDIENTSTTSHTLDSATSQSTANETAKKSTGYSRFRLLSPTLSQDAVVARDESERNIDLLIRDLQIAIKDIADIGMGSIPDESQDATSEPTAEPIRKLEGRNREAIKRAQPLVSTRRETERKSKPIGWVAIQNRLQELYSRWTEARRSARSAVFAAISVHPSTNSASNLTPKRENHRVYLGSQDDLSTSRVGTAKRSTTARSSRSVKSAPLSRIDESSGYPTIKLSHILGVSPAQSIGRAQDDVQDSLLSIALDLSRVHLLQQDLVNFSKSAFEFTHQIRSLSLSTALHSSSQSIVQDTSFNQSLSGITEDISFDQQFTNLSLHSSQSTIPIHSKKTSRGESMPFQVTTDSLLNYEESLNTLRVQSRSLLLHLSCLAPLAPLSMGKTNGKNIQTSVGFYMPLSSSQTGLDLLVEMMIEILEPRKLLTPAIQRVIDRSQSEQMVLLKTIHESQKTTQKWKQVSRESHSIFKTMAKSLNDIFRETIKELQRLQNSLLTISRAWLTCGQSRIQLPHAADLVCPVEMLSRGYLGEEMASLMNTMKLYEQDFTKLLEQITLLKNRFHTEFNSSVVNSLLNCYQKFSEIN